MRGSRGSRFLWRCSSSVDLATAARHPRHPPFAVSHRSDYKACYSTFKAFSAFGYFLFFWFFLVDIHSFIHQTTTCTYHIFTPSFLVSTQSLDLPINQSTHAHLRFHLICIISVASASQVLHPHFVFYKSYLVASQFEQKRNLNDNQDGLEDKPLVLLQLFRYNGWDSVQQCSQSGRKYTVTNFTLETNTNEISLHIKRRAIGPLKGDECAKYK
jgi:hypothetical protein